MLTSIKKLFGGATWSRDQIKSYFKESEGFDATSKMLDIGVGYSKDNPNAELSEITKFILDLNKEESLMEKTKVAFKRKHGRDASALEQSRMRNRSNDYDDYDNSSINSLLLYMVITDAEAEDYDVNVQSESGEESIVASSFDEKNFDSYVEDSLKTETTNYDTGSSYESSGSGSGSGDSSGSGSGSGSGCGGD